MVNCIGCDKPISTKKIMCANCWEKIHAMDFKAYPKIEKYFKKLLRQLIPKLVNRRDKYIIRKFTKGLTVNETVVAS